MSGPRSDGARMSVVLPCVNDGPLLLEALASLR